MLLSAPAVVYQRCCLPMLLSAHAVVYPCCCLHMLSTHTVVYPCCCPPMLLSTHAVYSCCFLCYLQDTIPSDNSIIPMLLKANNKATGTPLTDL